MHGVGRSCWSRCWPLGRPSVVGGETFGELAGLRRDTLGHDSPGGPLAEPEPVQGARIAVTAASGSPATPSSARVATTVVSVSSSLSTSAAGPPRSRPVPLMA